MENRVLLVSTYRKLSNVVWQLSEEIELDLSVYEGGVTKNGHLYAKDNENSFDVIVSNGGTAEAIKDIVTTPVISISPGIFNFLEAVSKARLYSNNVGLFFFSLGSLSYIERIKNIFGIDLRVFTYSNREELKIRLEEAAELGISSIVSMGDCVLELGEKNNLKTFVVHNNELQIKESLMLAKCISELKKRDAEKTDRLTKIINHSSDGIILLDKEGTVKEFNPIAEKIFNLRSSQILKQSIYCNNNATLITQIYNNSKALDNELLKINNKQYYVNKIPVDDDGNERGIMLSFRELSESRYFSKKNKNNKHKTGLIAKYNFSDICGTSAKIKNIIEYAKKISKTDATVMITGETGTGKELFAQSIHNYSLRNSGPFVAINCAAIPKNLLESELFGYEEGAFTGARKGGKPGLFELANGGTIFLDEVSEIPINMQGRLLRVLQEKEIIRIGGNNTLKLDFRVISAANTDLFNLVNKGEFREDLYYRLNIMDLRLPSLCERKEDIMVLLNILINRCNRKHNTNILNITNSAVKIMESYDWPGNVRQLQNFVEKACLLAEHSTIDDVLVNRMLQKNAFSEERISQSNGDVIMVRLDNLKEVENQVIKKANEIFNGDKTFLAKKLGISRTTLWKRLKEIDDKKKNV